MTNVAQIEAGRHFSQETKKLFDEFTDSQRRAVIKRMRAIGKKEVKNTKDRLKRGSKVAAFVGRYTKGIESDVSMSQRKGDYGTLHFGVFKPLKAKKGRISDIDNMAALLATDLTFSPITPKTEAQKIRGFIFARNHPTTRPQFYRGIKLGYVHPDIPATPDFLVKAQENIIRDFKTLGQDLVRAWKKTDKANRGKR